MKKSFAEVDNMFLISKIVSPKSSRNVRSRYLTESTGSCHDLCKYGKKHESRLDEKRLCFRRFVANNMDLASVAIDQKKNSANKMNSKDIVEGVEQSVTPLSQVKTTLERATESLANDNELYDCSIKIDSKANSPAYRSMESLEMEIITRNLDHEKFHPQIEDAGNAELSNDKSNEKHANKAKSSSMAKLNPAKSNKLKQKKLSTPAGMKNGGNMKETIPPSKPEVINLKIVVSRKQVESPKLQSSNQSNSFPSKKKNSSAMPATSLNVKNPLIRSTSQLKISAKCDFHEKITKAIEPKLGGKSMDTLENSITELDGYVSESAVVEPIKHSSNERIQSKHRRSASEKEDKRQRKTAPSVRQQAGGSPSPYKLKFKKGRVVDLGAFDISAPKKLRFRRGRILDENLNGVEALKRSFRRKRAIGDSNDCNSQHQAILLKKATSEPKGAILKHQDAPGKKQVGALFNHVIEETASKLVETRKSKVKALVGAFETVISLQEAKPVSVV